MDTELLGSAMPLTLAYVDPGSGLLILQIILATVAGVGFYFKKIVKKISQIFKSKQN